MALWTRHLHAVQRFQKSGDVLGRGDVEVRLAAAPAHLAKVSAAEYLKELAGTIGADASLG
ncbi:MAG: hypothetical protein ABI759_03300 [Candidatus Solibacter sp.]